MVIILGATNDCHALHMLSACHKSGIRAALFDTSLFPSESSISWDPVANDGALIIDSQRYGFKEIDSVFWSTIGQPVMGQGTHTPVNQIAMCDSSSTLRTFFAEQSIAWVNSWQAFDFHRVKPRQLSLAAQQGVPIPHTYIGNDPDELVAFTQEHGKTICKPVYGGAHATLVDPSLLVLSRLQKVLKHAPVTIQRYIEGTNVRTFVIDQEVFSAEIISNQVDFRMHSEPEHLPISTPVPIQAIAVDLCHKFGLKWTAIDWRRNDEGDYVFLEANPSPMFIHFEQLTGYPITARLLSLLSKHPH
ncbi:hypothetical protein [Aliiglaciecola litoralis]|uniref:ATP-grasp domain-containing protein n=1 Tax=Aliiglaciecola litoralis TaxID=582857 RepID=A0ABP3X225_9ALTE